jgi:hypothetical protein
MIQVPLVWKEYFGIVLGESEVVMENFLIYQIDFCLIFFRLNTKLVFIFV